MGGDRERRGVLLLFFVAQAPGLEQSLCVVDAHRLLSEQLLGALGRVLLGARHQTSQLIFTYQ